MPTGVAESELNTLITMMPCPKDEGVSPEVADRADHPFSRLGLLIIPNRQEVSVWSSAFTGPDLPSLHSPPSIPHSPTHLRPLRVLRQVGAYSRYCTLINSA